MPDTMQQLQIEEDDRHQQRQWRFERIGWAVMATLLLGGLLGAFGDGPLSRAQAGRPDTLSVDYDRLQRAKAPTEYRFQANPGLVRDGQLRLRFDAALLEQVELQSIIPDPESVRSGPGYTEFVLAMDPSPGRQSADVVFRFQPVRFGHVRGRVTAAGAEPLVIDQYIYP
jgi:hypothetical protein